METSLLVLTCLAGIFLSWLFSGAETGFYLFSRVRLQLGLQQAERAARHIEALVAKPRLLLAVLLVGNNVALELVAFSSQVFFARHSTLAPEAQATIIAVVSTPFLFLVCEAFPKSAFMARPYALLSRFAALLRLLYLGLWPVGKLIAGLTGRLSRAPRDGIAEIPVGGVEPALHVGLREGTLTRTEHLLAASVLRSGRLRVRDIAVPTTLMPALVLPAEAGRWGRSLPEDPASSRALVLDPGRTHIVGMVHFLDLALAISEGREDLESVIRPLPEVAPDLPIGDLMELLGQEKVPLAVVQPAPRAAPRIVRASDVVDTVLGAPRYV